LELALLCHRAGELIHPAEAEDRCGFRIRSAAARIFLFGSEVGEVIGEFGQIAPHVPWRDASTQQAFAKFME
jgi:hypothetical protein